MTKNERSFIGKIERNFHQNSKDIFIKKNYRYFHENFERISMTKSGRIFFSKTEMIISFSKLRCMLRNNNYKNQRNFYLESSV